MPVKARAVGYGTYHRAVLRSGLMIVRSMRMMIVRRLGREGVQGLCSYGLEPRRDACIFLGSVPGPLRAVMGVPPEFSGVSDGE